MSARSAASEGGMVQCERCGGRFEVSGAESAAKKALACRECGHTVDAWVLPVVAGAKWTLVDPTGTATTFSSWPELMTALRSSGISAVSEKTDVHEPGERVSTVPMSRSAFALLEQTPQAPPVAARPRLTSVVDKKEDPSVDRDAETRDPPPVAPVAAIPPPARPHDEKGEGKSDDWSDDVEMISLRDIQVVVPAASSAPLPPPRGALRTLPPAAGSDAPPPPTISVDDVIAANATEPEELDDDDVEPAPPTSRSPAVAPVAAEAKEAKEAKNAESEPKQKAEKAASEPKQKKAEPEPKPKKAEAETKPKSERAAASSPPSRAPAKSAPPKPVEEPSSGGWLMPVAVVALLAGGIAVVMRNRSPEPPPAPTTTETQPATKAPAPTETTTAATPAPSVTETPTKPVEKAAETTSAPKPDAPKPAAGDAPKPAGDAPKKPAGDPEMRLPLADTLDAAGKARRAGDFARAKDLYGRALAQSPGNVEAYSGLGAIARSTGDLAAARDSYQKALGSSPGFLPALLGLADVEWELGDKSSAKNHYEQYSKSAPSVPDRVRERTQPAQ